MPRKVNYGIDYDEEYEDTYDYDYDYDHEYDAPENPEAPKRTQETLKSGVWRCPICTFDNEESMSACDICGVLRNPLVKVHSSNDKTLAPFKFDSPSPDDLVSRVPHTSKQISKANDKKLYSSDITLKIEDKKPANESISDAKNFDMSFVEMGPAHGSGVDDMYSSRNGGNPQSISDSLNNVSLTAKPGPSKVSTAGRPTTNAHYKPEKWMLPDRDEDKLMQLNLAIVGHVDSGKSTLSGRLLHILGFISQKQMHKYQKEAKVRGKGSFAYAWALDESVEERERGITMTVAVAYLNSKRYRVVLLDSPGHKDFVPNMISGATQADAAILVVDASVGSFEAGMDINGGQTREHAQLIRSFGVDQVIVAINKMDVVEYSKERFGVIKQHLATFLRSCGFKDSSLMWVPLSAAENQNLVAPASDRRLLSWYKGCSLLEAIDYLQPPDRDYTRPLLMPICDVIKVQSQGQVSICGKLEGGALKIGSKVLVMPSGEIGTVRSLERDSQACAIARAGDNVSVSLQGIDGIHIMAGGVLCHPDFPIAISNSLELKILTLDVATPILIGSQLELYIHHAKETARIVKILSLLDPKTGKETKKAPRVLLAKQQAVVRVAIREGVCVAEFSSCKALGRVFLRASGKTLAVGVVTRIIREQDQ